MECLQNIKKKKNTDHIELSLSLSPSIDAFNRIARNDMGSACRSFISFEEVFFNPARNYAKEMEESILYCTISNVQRLSRKKLLTELFSGKSSDHLQFPCTRYFTP